jgi:hypothetical protein
MLLSLSLIVNADPTLTLIGAQVTRKPIVSLAAPLLTTCLSRSGPRADLRQSIAKRIFFADRLRSVSLGMTMKVYGRRSASLTMPTIIASSGGQASTRLDDKRSQKDLVGEHNGP